MVMVVEVIIKLTVVEVLDKEADVEVNQEIDKEVTMVVEEVDKELVRRSMTMKV